MSDTTDLSKLSSTEIIAKIVNLAMGCDAGKIWTGVANAKLHVLTVVLKQIIIREASTRLMIIPERMPDEPIPVQTVFKSFPAGNYYIVPTDDVPPWFGLLATSEEIAAMKKETDNGND